jgi:purine-cytosine permease-like protein
VVIFGEAIWDPVVLLGRFHQPAVALVALIALLLATLNTNVAANVASPSNDFSNLNPLRISFRAGGLITGCLGLAMMPWKLLGDYSAYIFGWLVGYSALLGPIAGIMIVDYFRCAGERWRSTICTCAGGSTNTRAVSTIVRWRHWGAGCGGAFRAGGSGVTLAVRLRLVRGIFRGGRAALRARSADRVMTIAKTTLAQFLVSDAFFARR